MARERASIMRPTRRRAIQPRSDTIEAVESALDRFARTRGVALVGSTAYGRNWKIQTWVGGVCLGIAGVVAASSVAVHDPSIAYGALGPFLAGTINTTLGLGFRRAARNQSSVALTDEAAALLRALVARAQVWQGGWRPRHARMHGAQAWPGYRAPIQPSAGMMDALERAAEAHNRVSDVLGDAHDERAARLRSAADAGIGEALHLAATGRADAAEIERVVARLDELAGLVERSVEGPAATSALRSNLESTLEELRAEEEARRELRG